MVDGSDTAQAIEGDYAAAVNLHSNETLSDAYRPYERLHFSITGPDGKPASFEREVLRCGEVVGVVAIDLARDAVVLIRQFRIAAHLATGRGDLVEIVAGRIDGEEGARAAAIRECQEEIALTPKRLAKVLTFIPAGAFSDELMNLFVAEVDSSGLPDLAGHEEEGEIIKPFLLPIDTALALAVKDTWRSVPLVVGMLWLGANRDRLDAVLSAGESA